MKALKIIFFPITLLIYLGKKLLLGLNRIYTRQFFKNTSISKIDAVTGDDFENICKLIFKYAGYSVFKTPRSNDYGADLIITKKYKIVVQAKLYYKNAVSNKAVQEAVSALKVYSADIALVITNWKFTAQAKKLAKIQNVILIERDDIMDFLNDIKNKTKKSIVFNLIDNYKVNLINLKA